MAQSSLQSHVDFSLLPQKKTYGLPDLPPWITPQVPQQNVNAYQPNKLSRLGQYISAMSGNYNTVGDRTQAINGLPQLWRQEDIYGSMQDRQAKQDEMAQEKFELDKQYKEAQINEMGLPKKRTVVQGADGYKYYQDNGERVLPNVQAKADTGTSTMQNAAMLFPNDPVKQKEYVQNVTTMSRAPVVNVNNGAPKLPVNQMWVDPNNPREGVTFIPGSELDPESPNYKMPESLKQSKQGNLMLDNLQSSYDSYRILLQEHGAEIMPGEAKLKLDQAYKNLLLELKEAKKLGVLAGPDMDLMEGMIIDPTSLSAKFAYDDEDILSQLDELPKMIEKQRNNLNTLYPPIGKPQNNNGWSMKRVK